MNWYAKLVNSQVVPPEPVEPPQDEPERPQQPAQSTTEEQALSMAPQVADDFQKGVNIEPMASNQLPIKTAGQTNHFRHRKFFESFAELPNNIKELAREKFRLMVGNPRQVNLKSMPGLPNIWSAQIGNSYRALAVKVGPYYVWYWVGSHERYNEQKDATPPEVFQPDPNYKAKQQSQKGKRVAV